MWQSIDQEDIFLPKQNGSGGTEGLFLKVNMNWMAALIPILGACSWMESDEALKALAGHLHAGA